MENGVQALKLASSVLIFVIAISITISAFTTLAQTLNRMFVAQDADEYVKLTDQTTGEEYYLNFVRFNGGTREVKVETIIPSIYRAYKENYSIYFYNNDGQPFILRKEKDALGNDKEINYIDLEKESHGTAELAIQSINELLYEQGLYEKLKKYTFTEKLGEYYMDDVGGSNEGVADVNKTKKRVIAYIAKTSE